MSFFGRYENRDENYRITIPKMLNEIEEQMKGKMKIENFMGGGSGEFILFFPWKLLSE